MSNMKFNEYQAFVAEMPLYDDPVLGLTGEVGEVVEIIKKDRRPGDKRKPADKAKLTLEFGDILWYLARSANDYGIDLQSIADENINKLVKRHGG